MTILAETEIPLDSEPQQNHIVEMAMITRTEYDLWKSAYDVLQRLGEAGYVTDEMILQVRQK